MEKVELGASDGKGGRGQRAVGCGAPGRGSDVRGGAAGAPSGRRPIWEPRAPALPSLLCSPGGLWGPQASSALLPCRHAGHIRTPLGPGRAPEGLSWGDAGPPASLPWLPFSLPLQHPCPLLTREPLVCSAPPSARSSVSHSLLIRVFCFSFIFFSFVFCLDIFQTKKNVAKIEQRISGYSFLRSL